MTCSGIDVGTGLAVEVEFGETIEAVRVLEQGEEGLPWIAPGFVDLQVNGFAGVDFNDPSASTEAVGRALDAILKTGVTRCLPAVITGPPDDMLACLKNLWRARMELPNGAAIAGFHVEGPAIGVEDGPRGAHPAQWVRPPSLDEFQRWQEATEGHIRLITFSPHWPESAEFVRVLTRAGTAVAIGHTAASAEAITAAVEAGAALSTHLGNAAPAMMRKHPNCLWDQLAEDRLSAGFIADGIHVGRAFLRTALRAKTVTRTVLVTDASAPAGAAPGRYRLGGQDAELTSDGRVVLAGTDKLAGSALRMNDGIRNMMELGGLTLRDSVQTATVNPARLIGLEGRMEGLKAGERADLAVFRMDGSMRIEAVYLDGRAIE